jgi:hypothetical protein
MQSYSNHWCKSVTLFEFVCVCVCVRVFVLVAILPSLKLIASKYEWAF